MDGDGFGIPLLPCLHMNLRIQPFSRGFVQDICGVALRYAGAAHLVRLIQSVSHGGLGIGAKLLRPGQLQLDGSQRSKHRQCQDQPAHDPPHPLCSTRSSKTIQK